MPEVAAYDAFAGFSSGMRGGIDPLLLKEDSYAKGINVSCRGYLAQTRPGFVDCGELAAGIYQRGKKWSLNSKDYFVTVISRNVLVFDGDTYALVFTLLDAFTEDRCYFEQVDRWFVIQDGTSRPVVLSESGGVVGIYGRDAPLVCYVPGTVMQYAHGRLHYVPTKVALLSPATTVGTYDVMPESSATLNGRMEFVSSDIRDTLNPEYVFRLSEHRVLAEGGAVALPLELGYITAMTTYRNAATGSGVGELLVFARNGMCAFSVNAARAQWKSTNISQVLFMGPGTMSPESPLPVNRDVYYIDTEGYLRRVNYDAGQLSSGSSLSNIPISNEMKPFIEITDTAALPYASISHANNRVLFSTAGSSDGSFRALGSLDLEHLGAVQEMPEIFDGAWTGFNFRQTFSMRRYGRYAQYAVVQQQNSIHLLRVDESAITDPGETLIESQLHTRMFPMIIGENPAPNDLKVLKSVELWLNQIKTSTLVEVFYRPSHSPIWSLAGSKQINHVGSVPQARRRIAISLDIYGTDCDPLSNEKLCVGNAFQLCIRWTGNLRIDRCLLSGSANLEEPSRNCDVDNADAVGYSGTEGHHLDDFSYMVML